MRKRIIMLLALVVSLLTAKAQQHISGAVTDSLGQPIFKAYVLETDETDRIINQTTTDRNGLFTMAFSGIKEHYLRITADGFVSIHRRMEQTASNLKIKMAERPKARFRDIMQSAKGKKRKMVRSTKLFCGRSGIQEVPWMVQIEQLNDTIFSLQMPVTSINKNGTYPEGRTMVFLDKNDYHMLMGYNCEDAYPIIGNPSDEDTWNTIGKDNNFGKYNAQNASLLTDSNEPVYYYPQFLFTLDELQMLCKQADNLSYIIIDIETGDNYWNVYPLESFGKELTRILTKLQKK